MAVLAGKLEARCKECAPAAGKSTLNRLELSRLKPTRYHKISHNPIAIKKLLVDLFLEAHAQARARLSSILMRPMTRCTGSRRDGSSTAITPVRQAFTNQMFDPLVLRLADLPAKAA